MAKKFENKTPTTMLIKMGAAFLESETAARKTREEMRTGRKKIKPSLTARLTPKIKDLTESGRILFVRNIKQEIRRRTVELF